jgi:hypothetical protein
MRRRVVDSSFWTDSKITSLSFSARLLYIGLWQYADDQGLFKKDLRNIKMELFPDQRFPLEKCFNELEKAGFFRFGTLDGETVVEIRNFLNHQTINRPTPSKLREKTRFTEDSVNPQAPLTEDSLLREVKLREEKEESDKLIPDSQSFSISKKRKRAAPADPRIQPFLSWFAEEYEKRFGAPYATNWGKDGKRIKGLSPAFDVPKLKELALQFFESDDSWIREKGGFTVGVFLSQINKLASTTNGNSNSQDTHWRKRTFINV